MSDDAGKRKAGFFAKLVATMAWGLVIGVGLRFYLPESFLGVERPPLATFFLIGLGWPLLWLLFWGIRVITPMPFELVPRLFELILVGPGHLAAWILFGKRQPAEGQAPAPKEATPPQA